MKDIITIINENIITEKLSISKNEQMALIDKYRSELVSKLTAEPANYKEKERIKSKKFAWIPPKNANSAVDQFEGAGWTTKTPLKDVDKQKMIDLISNNGGWFFEYYPMSYYNKSYCKFIISISNDNGKYTAIMMRGYNGCWTMSGEDYVSGKYTMEEIELN